MPTKKRSSVVETKPATPAETRALHRLWKAADNALDFIRPQLTIYQRLVCSDNGRSGGRNELVIDVDNGRIEFWTRGPDTRRKKLRTALLYGLPAFKVRPTKKRASR